MRWIEKGLISFRILMTFSISMQSLGEIELRAPAEGAKIGVLLYVTLGLPARGGHSDGLWVDFDAIFSGFFRKDCSVRCTTWFSFTSPSGATLFAKLPSKIT